MPRQVMDRRSQAGWRPEPGANILAATLSSVTFGPFHEVAGTGPEQENIRPLYFPNSRAVYTGGRSVLMEVTGCLPDFHRVWAFWQPGWELQGELAALRSQVRVNRII